MFYRKVCESAEDIDFINSEAPSIPRKTIIREFTKDGEKTGEIRIEDGADGTYLLFDCDCLDALPYCRAQCCGLRGTFVFDDELELKNLPVETDPGSNQFVMKRDSDGLCSCLDRQSKHCLIYDDRPRTCQQFHCTRGADVRGWKLSNYVHRQSMM